MPDTRIVWFLSPFLPASYGSSFSALSATSTLSPSQRAVDNQTPHTHFKQNVSPYFIPLHQGNRLSLLTQPPALEPV